MSSLVTARDDIQGIVYTALPGTTIHWDGVPVTSRPLPTQSWAQVVVRHAAGRQASLAGAHSKWEHVGVAIVAIYGTSRATGRALAETLQAAFEKRRTSSGVWFPSVVVKEIGADDAWYHWSVEVNFRWEEWS